MTTIMSAGSLIARTPKRNLGPCSGTCPTPDYAIVARIHDNVTGQPVIVLAGILRQGTEAAGELVSNPVYLNAMLEKAPKTWGQMNLEVVIETHVIEGHPGPPTVIAIENW